MCLYGICYTLTLVIRSLFSGGRKKQTGSPHPPENNNFTFLLSFLGCASTCPSAFMSQEGSEVWHFRFSALVGSPRFDALDGGSDRGQCVSYVLGET